LHQRMAQLRNNYRNSQLKIISIMEPVFMKGFHQKVNGLVIEGQ